MESVAEPFCRREVIPIKPGVLFLVLLVLWSSLYGFLTLQNGAETELTGSALAVFLKQLLCLEAAPQEIHHALRMGAHVVGFLIEAVLFSFMLRAFRVGHPVLVSFLVCALLAVGTEAVKLGIAGRHFSWNDVGLNMIGLLVGVGIGLIACRR